MSFLKLMVLTSIYIEVYLILSNLTYNSWQNRFLNNMNSYGVKKNMFDSLHRKIKFTSGINRIAPHLNHYNFLFIVVTLLGISFMICYIKSQVLLPSIIISFTVSWIPLFILECFVQNSNQMLSNDMVTFISIMTRWAYVKDDVYFCIEKASFKVQGPLQEHLKEFIRNVKYSGNVIYSFDMLLLHSDNELFRNFVINIKQAEFSKGNLSQLLSRLEEEAYRIEGEHTRRQSETFFDRIIIYSTIVFVLILGIGILTFNEGMRSFYFYSIGGQYLLSAYALLFFLGIYVASKITTFNY